MVKGPYPLSKTILLVAGTFAFHRPLHRHAHIASETQHFTVKAVLLSFREFRRVDSKVNAPPLAAQRGDYSGPGKNCGRRGCHCHRIAHSFGEKSLDVSY